MAYDKQTWDTTSYVNPTRMNHMEDGIAAVDSKTAVDIPYSNNSNVKIGLESIVQTVSIGAHNTAKINANGGAVIFVYRGQNCDIYFVDSYGSVANLNNTGYLSLSVSGNEITITNNSGAMCLIVFIPYYYTPRA